MIGQTFSHYRILETMGDGDFPGPLYKAEELGSGSLVALRVLHSSFGLEERKRLIRIAAAASQLGHPNVESLVEVGETDDGELFCCSRFRPGVSLARWAECDELSAGDAFDIVAQVSKGLLRAHRAGIVHGAMKPGMVKLLEDHHVEVVGFGFAVLAGEGLSVRSGDPVAALSYRSPEQIRGGRPHPRIDVWALGIILYELLTGRRPFEGSTAGSLAESVLGDDPPPLGKAWKAVPSGLDRVLAKALSKEIGQRYQGVAELARDLAPFASRAGKPRRSKTLPAVDESPATPDRGASAGKGAAGKKAPSKAAARKAGKKKRPSKAAAKRATGAAPAVDAEVVQAAAAEAAAETIEPEGVAGPPPAGPEPSRVHWALVGGGLLLLAALAWLLGGL